MARLRLQGTIIHMPGTWGLSRPAEGAEVRIIDSDLKDADDVIFTGVTDANGAFTGRSSEWRDMGRTWDFINLRWVVAPDVTDALVLRAEITHGPHSISLPFTFINDTVPSPPLIVPWGPPLPFAKVNGQECETLDETVSTIMAEVDAGKRPIIIEVYDRVTADIFEKFTTMPVLRDWLRSQGVLNRALGGDDVFLVLIGLAILISVTLLALALLYAIHKGYSRINFEQSIAAPGGEATTRIEVG